MLLISPSCDILKRAVISNALSSISTNSGAENIIVDFSVPASNVFWSMYKESMKYVEDILPVLSGTNPKMLKNFLSPLGSTVVLGLESKQLDEFDIERILYLINVLEKNYKYVFILLPQTQNSKNSLEILKTAKSVLMPFSSDSLSARDVLLLADFYISNVGANINIIPLKLDIGYEFHSQKVLNNHEHFKNIISVNFDNTLWKQILSPRYSYRDNSNSFVAVLKEVINRYDIGKKSNESLSVNEKDSTNEYFSNEEVYKELSEKVYGELVKKMEDFANETDVEVLKNTAKIKIDEILKKLDLQLPQAVSDRLIKELCDDVAGLGILEDFIKDPAITEIMVNGANSIYIEKKGKIIQSPTVFPDEKRLRTVIDRIVSQTGRHIDESSPIVDSRLRDGSRVNAVIRPIALNGPVLTIRKFLKNKLSTDALVASAAITNEMVEFLKTTVILKKNIIISGGTGTGKTTLLNAVSSFIPGDERLVTIEDSAELQLQQNHVVRLEARPKSTEGTGEIDIRRLVVNALRMRPDRIIVGECRSGEALDMLQAMNTGHEGSMSTVHANSAADAVSRLVTMVLMSGADLPEQSIISQIASAVNVIVQLTRYFDGTRKISAISVLNKVDNAKQYEIKPVFEFKLSGIKDGKQEGEFKPTGFIPDFIQTASNRGVTINMKIFK